MVLQETVLFQLTFNRILKGGGGGDSLIFPKVPPIFFQESEKGSPVTPSSWTPPPLKNPINVSSGK